MQGGCHVYKLQVVDVISKDESKSIIRYQLDASMSYGGKVSLDQNEMKFNQNLTRDHLSYGIAAYKRCHQELESLENNAESSENEKEMNDFLISSCSFYENVISFWQGCL